MIAGECSYRRAKAKWKAVAGLPLYKKDWSSLPVSFQLSESSYQTDTSRSLMPVNNGSTGFCEIQDA